MIEILRVSEKQDILSGTMDGEDDWAALFV